MTTPNAFSGAVKVVLVVLALLLVVATALPLLHFDQWWIRIFDYPRGQITIAGIVVLPLLYLTRLGASTNRRSTPPRRTMKLHPERHISW